MAYLSYLPDDQFKRIVCSVVDAGVAALQTSNLERNVIDPFAMLFEMAAFGLDETQWTKNERTRQAQKTMINRLGDLHQRILGAVTGWEDLGVGSKAGCDIVNHEKKIIAEIKNKHNTVKKSDEIVVYRTLEELVMRKSSMFKGYTAYFVKIIPEKPCRYDEPCTPSDKATGCSAAENPLIRVIDGYSFYGMVTGQCDAMMQLFEALPKVLMDCYPESHRHLLNMTQAGEYFRKAYGA